MDSCVCAHGDRVAIYDSAAQGWYAVDVDDADDLVERLEDDEREGASRIGDTYSVWCSETASEKVEIEE